MVSAAALGHRRILRFANRDGDRDQAPCYCCLGCHRSRLASRDPVRRPSARNLSQSALRQGRGAVRAPAGALVLDAHRAGVSRCVAAMALRRRTGHHLFLRDGCRDFLPRSLLPCFPDRRDRAPLRFCAGLGAVAWQCLAHDCRVVRCNDPAFGDRRSVAMAVAHRTDVAAGICSADLSDVDRHRRAVRRHFELHLQGARRRCAGCGVEKHVARLRFAIGPSPIEKPPQDFVEPCFITGAVPGSVSHPAMEPAFGFRASAVIDAFGERGEQPIFQRGVLEIDRHPPVSIIRAAEADAVAMFPRPSQCTAFQRVRAASGSVITLFSRAARRGGSSGA